MSANDDGGDGGGGGGGDDIRDLIHALDMGALVRIRFGDRWISLDTRDGKYMILSCETCGEVCAPIDIDDDYSIARAIRTHAHVPQ